MVLAAEALAVLDVVESRVFAGLAFVGVARFASGTVGRTLDTLLVFFRFLVFVMVVGSEETVLVIALGADSLGVALGAGAHVIGVHLAGLALVIGGNPIKSISALSAGKLAFSLSALGAVVDITLLAGLLGVVMDVVSGTDNARVALVRSSGAGSTGRATRLAGVSIRVSFFGDQIVAGDTFAALEFLFLEIGDGVVNEVVSLASLDSTEIGTLMAVHVLLAMSVAMYVVA